MWKALKCIKDLVNADTDGSNLYGLALAANAFAVAGDKALVQKILKRLDKAATVSGTKGCGAELCGQLRAARPKECREGEGGTGSALWGPQGLDSLCSPSCHGLYLYCETDILCG